MTRNSKSILKSSTLWLALLLFWGIALRSIQYFGGSSLWLDELFNAKNVESRDFQTLMTESLDFNQVAPVGFLVGEKVVISIFGSGDLAFRFLPWISSVIALLCFWLLARSYLKGVKLFAATSLFAASVALIQQAGNAKQYSGDVAVCVLLIWATASLVEKIPRTSRAWIIALAGGLGACMSFPGAIMVFVLLALWAVHHRRHLVEQLKFPVITIASVWIVGASLNLLYAHYVVSETTRTAMKGWWASGFPPAEGVISVLTWIPGALNNALGHFMFFIKPPMPLAVLPIILIILSVAGLVYLFRKEAIAGWILSSPILVGLALALAGILPMRQRVALFAVWPIMILSFLGLMALQDWLKRIVRPALSNGVALLLSLPILLIVSTVGRPPYIAQPAEPVLSELKNQMQAEDVLYVYCKSKLAVERYGPKVGIENWVQGDWHKAASDFKPEVETFGGKSRVWFFYTQWTASQPFPDSIRAYFESMGKQIAHIPDPFGGKGLQEATAYLYDLSDAYQQSLKRE